MAQQNSTPQPDDAQRSSVAPDSYVGSEISVAAVHDFFLASQRMFRAAPWSVIPEFTAVLAVNCTELGQQDAVLAIVGPPAPNYGAMLFASVADFSAYLHAARAMSDFTRTDDAMATMPGWVGSEFRPGAAISARMLLEIKTHNWPIAGPVAFPIITAMTGGGEPRATTAHDVRLLTVLHQAMAELIVAEPRLGFAWEPTSPSTTRTLQVQLGADAIALAITLTAPHPQVALPFTGPAATNSTNVSADKSHKENRSANDVSKDKAKRKAQKTARKKNR